MFTLIWHDSKRTYEIVGNGYAILAIYNYLKNNGNCFGFHAFKHGKEYDLDKGLTSEKGASESEISAMKAENEELKEYYNNVLREPCPDEQHCTCVPGLRKYIEELESENEILNDRWKRYRDTIKKALDWGRKVVMWIAARK